MKHENPLYKALFVVFLSLTLIACNNDDDDDVSVPAAPETAPTITETAIDTESLSTLVTALGVADLANTLNEPGSFTVFAPTNAAFEKLDPSTLDALLADPEALADILLYHVVIDNEIDSMAAIDAAGTTLTMANGDDLAVTLSGSDLLVNFSTVTNVDIVASNGTIHLIDTVLIPPTDPIESGTDIVQTAIDNGSFTTLLTALQATGLDQLLDDSDNTFTVFAPTDAAFDALPDGTLTALLGDIPALTDILELHVIAGAAVDYITALSLSGVDAETAGGETVSIQIIDGSLTVGGATIVAYDIVTTNGIIHVIDTVITE